MPASLKGEPLVWLVDTREPWPHPWMRFLAPWSQVQQATLETGDWAIAGMETIVAIERKTVPDLLGCMGKERERFERELARSRNLAGFAVVVEGSWQAFLTAGHVQRNFTVESLEGSIAALSRRYRVPFMFCCTVELAARWAIRFLTSGVTELEDRLAKVRGAVTRTARAVARAAPEPEAEPEPF
jgi:DNA excision repair protein ERCC-4